MTENRFNIENFKKEFKQYSRPCIPIGFWALNVDTRKAIILFFLNGYICRAKNHINSSLMMHNIDQELADIKKETEFLLKPDWEPDGTWFWENDPEFNETLKEGEI